MRLPTLLQYLSHPATNALVLVVDHLGVDWPGLQRARFVGDINRMATVARATGVGAVIAFGEEPCPPLELLARDAVLRMTRATLDPWHNTKLVTAVRYCDLVVSVESSTGGRILKNRYGRADETITFEPETPECRLEPQP